MRVSLHNLAGLTSGALAVLLLASGSSAVGAENDTPASAQQLYNQGTEKFHQGKLREAESSLQLAVTSQNEKVQIPALYNLGHVRFQEGVEELKGGPNAKSSDAAAKAACENAEAALKVADDALGGWDVQAIVAAYMQGR